MSLRQDIKRLNRSISFIMKYILTYILIWWFYISPYRALMCFSDCYLANTTECSDCKGFDFNNDKWIDLIDFTLLVE